MYTYALLISIRGEHQQFSTLQLIYENLLELLRSCHIEGLLYHCQFHSCSLGNVLSAAGGSLIM